MKFILGTKEEMTQVFDEAGRVRPATVVSAGPIVITQVKTHDTDGYSSVQVGFGIKTEHRTSRPEKGHFKGPGYRVVKEFRPRKGSLAEVKVGDKLDVSVFTPGDTVRITGVSKAKGFQGVVKRHKFGGGRRTHGQKHSEREPGSIGGAGRAGGRVVKGMRMAGRMGGDRVTVRNLKVLSVDPATNTLIVSGAIPGRRGTVVEVVSQDS